MQLAVFEEQHEISADIAQPQVVIMYWQYNELHVLLIKNNNTRNTLTCFG
jgi:hypothetical protein